MFSPNSLISASVSLTFSSGNNFINLSAFWPTLKNSCILPASEFSGIPSVIFLAYVKFFVPSVILLAGMLNILLPISPVLLFITSLNVSPSFTFTALTKSASFTLSSFNILSLRDTLVCVVGVFVSVSAIWSIPEAGRQLGEPDHGQIVIDEWAGMWLAAFGISFYTNLTVWTGLCLGFIGFRIFDITKPGIVSWCERQLPGAWGVLMDDVAAGGYVLILALVFDMISA